MIFTVDDLKRKLGFHSAGGGGIRNQLSSSNSFANAVSKNVAPRNNMPKPPQNAVPAQPHVSPYNNNNLSQRPVRYQQSDSFANHSSMTSPDDSEAQVSAVNMMSMQQQQQPNV